MLNTGFCISRLPVRQVCSEKLFAFFEFLMRVLVLGSWWILFYFVLDTSLWMIAAPWQHNVGPEQTTGPNVWGPGRRLHRHWALAFTAGLQSSTPIPALSRHVRNSSGSVRELSAMLLAKTMWLQSWLRRIPADSGGSVGDFSQGCRQNCSGELFASHKPIYSLRVRIMP